MRLKRKKEFVSFENVIAWGLSKQNDPTYTYAYNQALHFFQNAASLFNGSLTYVDENGETANYPNLGITEIDLINHYLEEYGSRLCARPLDIGRIGITSGQPMNVEDAMSVVLDILYRKTQFFVKANSYKYLTLVKSTGFTYNPIENFNVSESATNETEFGKASTKTGNITNNNGGRETLDRTVKHDEVSHVSIEGPITGSSISYTETVEGAGTISGFSLSDKDKVSSGAESNAGDTQYGQKAGSASVNTASGTTTASTTGGAADARKTSNYTTTYDSDTEHLSNSTGEAGSVAQTLNSVKSQRETELIHARIEKGNPSAYGFTDTRSFTDRTDTQTFNSVKDQLSGTDTTTISNIKKGITGKTYQDLIQEERQVAAFNVVEDFCLELNKQILLGVYDYGIPVLTS